jgi:hypothetical protein
MFVTVQQLEQQMPDATRLLSDEPEMDTLLHGLLQLEQERLRSQRLAEHLRSLGVNPDSLS